MNIQNWESSSELRMPAFWDEFLTDDKVEKREKPPVKTLMDAENFWKNNNYLSEFPAWWKNIRF